MVAIEDRKKNTKVLSMIDHTQMLAMMKSYDNFAIAEHFAITVRAVQYIRRKYNAFTDEDIDIAIRDLHRKLKTYSSYPERDYEKQDKCDHLDCTVFLKCKCSLTLGENDLDRVIEILTKKRDYLRAHKPKEIMI